MSVINKVVVNGTYCIFSCLILHGYMTLFVIDFAGLILIILVSSLRALKITDV